jgi:hypothetical protein
MPEGSIPTYPGVVDQDVDATQFRDDLGDEFFHLGRLTDVTRGAHDLHVQLPKMLSGLPGLRPRLLPGIQEAERYVRPGPREVHGDHATDAAGAAAHDDDLTSEVPQVEERLKLSLNLHRRLPSVFFEEGSNLFVCQRVVR